MRFSNYPNYNNKIHKCNQHASRTVATSIVAMHTTKISPFAAIIPFPRIICTILVYAWPCIYEFRPPVIFLPKDVSTNSCLKSFASTLGLVSARSRCLHCSLSLLYAFLFSLSLFLSFIPHLCLLRHRVQFYAASSYPFLGYALTRDFRSTKRNGDNENFINISTLPRDFVL